MTPARIQAVERMKAGRKKSIEQKKTNSESTVEKLQSQMMDLQKRIADMSKPTDQDEIKVSRPVKIEKESKKAHDFMDGIMFSADRGVIMVGNLTNKKDGKAVRFCRAWDDWFYLHAEKRTNTASIRDDYIPLYDYLFRYDRGAFWMGRYAFTFLGMPFNAFWRFIHDRLFHTRKLYIALQQSGMAQKHIIQDVALPKSSAVDFLNFLDTKLSIYPLWLCPLLPDTIIRNL